VVRFSDGEGVAVWGCERGTSWCGGNFYPDQRVKLVAVGFRHYCVLLATGRVFCHGDDSFHQLGVPSVEGGFAALSSQANCTCGITALGHKVLCWGDANDAQGGECSAHTLPDRPYRQVLVLNWPYYGICAITDDGDSQILCTESVRHYMSVPGDRLVTQIVYLPNQGFFWF
jgi:alpha-tubulin suppressor-like RCC1 family protein